MNKNNDFLEIVLVGTDDEYKNFKQWFSFSEEQMWIRVHHYNSNDIEKIELISTKKIDFLLIWYEPKLEEIFNWSFYDLAHEKKQAL